MMSATQIKNLVDWSKLFGFMEYGENPNAEEIKQIILENLSADLKSSSIVNFAVDYYIETQSTICLEIMSGIRDQHEKHLFEKLNECIKSSATRTVSISLIGQLIKKQPSWLPRIVQNPVLTSLFKILKSDTSILNICNGVYTIIMLLPTVPSLIKQHLPEIFDIFSRLVIFYIRPGNMPQVHRLHLNVVLFEMFLRLYGMYPCHFLFHLRQCMNNYKEDRRNALLDGIKPMFLQVKLHPSLVTGHKDQEISMERWKKMEPHDVIEECGKMSVDSIEISKEDNLCNISFLQQSINSAAMGGVNCDSLQNSQTIVSPSSSSNIDNVAITSGHSSLKLSSTNFPVQMHTSSIGVTTNGQNGILWNSGMLGDMATPPPTPHTLSNSCSELTSSASASNRDSPLCEGKMFSTASNFKKNSKDLTLEITRNKNYLAQISSNSSQPSTPFNKEIIFQFPPSSPDAMYAHHTSPKVTDNQNNKGDRKLIEPTPIFHNNEIAANIPQDIDINDSRDDAADKEVENINQKLMQEENFDAVNHSGQVTPLSIRNLRVESSTPKSLFQDTASNKMPDIDSNFHMSIECSADQSDLHSTSRIMKTINRLRFFSQCVTTINTPKTLRRRKSCSDLGSSACVSVNSFNDQKDKGICHENDGRKFSLPITSTSTDALTSNTFLVTPKSESTPNSCFYVPSQLASQNLYNDNTNFSEGMATCLSNVNDPCRSHASTACSSQTASEPRRTSSLMKPVEILENYLLLGSNIHCSTVPLTSSKLTHWTHFGGQPPPDEIRILRDQIQLFQYQLVYERYKREVHSQRNRRLLCKAKEAKALVERNMAMKDQLELQEKEVQHLRNQAKEFQKRIQELNNKENVGNDNLLCKLRDLTKENENLKFSNCKLKELLVSHTDENNKLKEDLKYVRGQHFNIEKEIGIMHQQITFNSSLKSQIDTLNQELMLMGELHQRYREKYSHPVSKRKSEYNYEMFQEVADNELSGLKQTIEEKDVILQAQKARIAELEKALTNKDNLIVEQKVLLEHTNLGHIETLEAVELKYTAMRKVCQDLQVHIQELNDQIEVQKRPQEEIKVEQELRCKLPPLGIEAIKYNENEQGLFDKSPDGAECETKECPVNTAINENLSSSSSDKLLTVQDGAGHPLLNADDSKDKDQL